MTNQHRRSRLSPRLKARKPANASGGTWKPHDRQLLQGFPGLKGSTDGLSCEHAAGVGPHSDRTRADRQTALGGGTR